MENKKIINLLRSIADILETSETNENLDNLNETKSKIYSDLLDDKVLPEASRILKVMEAVDGKFKDKALNKDNPIESKVSKFKEETMEIVKNDLINEKEEIDVSIVKSIEKDLPN